MAGPVVGAWGRRPRVVIVAGELVVARHIQTRLEGLGCEVFPPVASGAELGPLLSGPVAPDLLVLDLELDTAEDIGRRLGVPVLVVSARSDPATLDRLRRLDVRGFVVKPFSEAQLVASLIVALENAAGDRVSPARGRRGGGPEVERRPASPRFERLSAREHEVMRELMAYRRPPQIAERLRISQHTVRNHLKSIFAKLGVHSQVELLELVAKHPPGPDRAASTK